MGSKSSHFYQANRPESGGANKDGMKDKTGVHEQDKQKLGSHRAELREEGLIPERRENAEAERLRGERGGTGSDEQGSE